MVYIRNPNALGEIPLHFAVVFDFLAVGYGNLRCQLVDLENVAAKLDFAIGFQIAHVGPLGRVNIIEIVGIGKPRIECKCSRNFSLDNPAYQLAEQGVVVLELPPVGLTLILFYESPELQRIGLLPKI